MSDQNDLFLSEKEQRRQRETPLMRQYWKIKDRHPGAILLFRMGDFYETFEEDARIAADVLGITLTKRSNGASGETPLAGFPHHALDQYLPKLVQAGHRVAVCEQLEDPKFARKVVKRDVVEVVTPGISFHEGLLTPKRSNYLAAAFWGKDRQGEKVGFAFLDASTGEFQATEVPASQFEEILQMISPAELLIDKRQKDEARALRSTGFVLTPQEDWVFGEEFAQETLLRHFKTHSLKGYGVEELSFGLIAAGAALYYLSESQKGRVPYIRKIRRYESSDFISLDPQARRNLELIDSMQGGRDGTLIQILDQTLTPMGGRLLRNWLVRPLRTVEKIQRRQEVVQTFHASERLRQGIREDLRGMGDLERLAARVYTGRATPRDLVALRFTLERIPGIQARLQDGGGPLAGIQENLVSCNEIVKRITDTLVDEPPTKLDVGGFIRSGFSEDLDELRQISKGGKEYLARLQKTESDRTGIPSLKVSYNKVFGYYIEVTNAHRDKVPQEWIRKQTLVNAERYITDELKTFEEKILTAEEKISEIEIRLFTELRQTIADGIEPVQKNAQVLAMLDVVACLAEVAVRHNYVQPEITDDGILDIEDGRHPVVEQLLPVGEAFVPNSIILDPKGEAGAQLLVITGPNMAGKSVVLRQTGLIVLLAQVGSFVPAKQARIGVVDKIFTRVGASDNLAAGESTFLVEMNEAANILNNATPKSLLLLDEVGRGTSTFDGLSIAWAIVEYLHDRPEVAARTLFATHYHELNALASRLPRVRNARIQVHEHDGRVIFLRKLVPGGADHSYGIEVARMAGLPNTVIDRAKQILKTLERHNVAEDIEVAARQALPEHIPPPTDEVLIPPELTYLREAISKLDPDTLTPVEALLKLTELKRMAE